MTSEPKSREKAPVYVEELRRAIEESAPRLLRMTEKDAKRRPQPGKWSLAEIIGHLIDSASNDHQRFVRAQFQNDLVFPGYDQDEWVAFQTYRDAQWIELVTLWKFFNNHIARIMENTPDSVR